MSWFNGFKLVGFLHLLFVAVAVLFDSGCCCDAVVVVVVSIIVGVVVVVIAVVSKAAVDNVSD